MLRNCLAETKVALGSKHPLTLHVLHNLALTCENQFQHEEAEKLFRKCLVARKKVLGLNDERTLRTICDILGVNLSRQGKVEESLEILKEMLPELNE